jgi:hypothetical protein
LFVLISVNPAKTEELWGPATKTAMAWAVALFLMGAIASGWQWIKKRCQEPSSLRIRLNSGDVIQSGPIDPLIHENGYRSIKSALDNNPNFELPPMLDSEQLFIDQSNDEQRRLAVYFVNFRRAVRAGFFALTPLPIAPEGVEDEGLYALAKGMDEFKKHAPAFEKMKTVPLRECEFVVAGGAAQVMTNERMICFLKDESAPRLIELGEIARYETPRV